MNGINNPELIRKLNDKVPQNFDELMKRTRSFIQGEAAAADSKKGYSNYRQQEQPRRQSNDQSSNRSKNYRGQGSGRDNDKYTPLTKTPREIFVTEGSFLTHKESLWVKWIHSYKLRGRSFWDVPCLGDVSWGWRKLLAIRPKVRPFIWHKINDGKATFVWFDMWCHLSPIRDMLTARDITRAGFTLSDSVFDVIENGTWKWPTDWFSRFPDLVNLSVPNLLNDTDDGLLWHDVDGNLIRFSVACAWDSLRLRADLVNWVNIPWFSHCIWCVLIYTPFHDQIPTQID